MNYYWDKQKKAANKVRLFLEASLENNTEMECDPWDALLPCFYGSYSREFDVLAIRVLTDIHDVESTNNSIDLHALDIRRDLASEMFREALCTHHYCDYGSSPRSCFTSSQFKPLLKPLIAKWQAYSDHQWS